MRGLISYARDEEVHNNNEYVNGERVLASDGIYCTTTDAYFQMREVQRLYGKDKNEIQALHVIQSFDDNQFNIEDPTAPERALEVSRLSNEQAYPNNQVAMYVQADGKGQKVHVHSIVNISDLDGRTLNWNERSYYYAAEHTDKAMIELGYTPLDAEKRQRDYTPKDKVNKGSIFASNRVIEEKMQKGMTEEQALQEALQSKELPNTEYAKIAIESTINDERVTNIDTFKEVLKNDYEITYKTGAERKRKYGIYEYDYLDQSLKANKRSSRDKTLGEDFMEKEIIKSINNKEADKDVEINRPNEYEQDLNSIQLEQQQQIQRQIAARQHHERNSERIKNKQRTNEEPPRIVGKPEKSNGKSTTNNRKSRAKTRGFEHGD